jgi:hypothetical protein
MSSKNFLLVPHIKFCFEDGGIVVQYYLAKLLDDMGVMIRIMPSFGNIENSLFNKYYNNEFNLDDNCIVIYCEGVIGNPLNAKYVIRWLLSEVGQNVPYHYIYTWGENELVYHFNRELKFKNNPDKVDNVFKTLSILYLSPEIKQYNLGNRNGCCYTIRKAAEIHKNQIHRIHPDNSYEITRDVSNDKIIQIFNNYEYFVSYDPITFLSIMAPLCGCISIVYPIEGVSKRDWFNKTCYSEYLEYNNTGNAYGIAYGLEEIEWAKNTIHLAKDQLHDMITYLKDKHIQRLLKDVENFDHLVNTIKNVFYK